MLPIVGMLTKAGVGLLAKVVAKKGTEFLKEKTGIDVEEVLQANNGVLPPDVAAEFKQFEMEHEEELLRIALEVKKVEAKVVTAVGQYAVTAHAADMKSDSWLSKNIRPLALVVVLITVVSGLFIDVPEGKYEQVVGLCKRAFEFYFGGRSLEKISGGVIERGKSLFNKIRGK